MALKQIFSQDKALGILQKAYAADRVAHAYIFAGMEGVGKFTTAFEFGKLLLCQNPVVENGFADSCSQCRACKLAEAGTHPDSNIIFKELREFTKDGAGKKPPVDLPIDVIREFLIEKIAQKPALSHRKVFIVKEAEKLNISSQNALLKSLEEPPEYCCIILICTRPELLLPTISSRCQTIRFVPVAEELITEKLQEKDAGEKSAVYFARLAQGSLGQALKWAQLDKTEAGLLQTKRQIVNAIADCKPADCLQLAGLFLSESKKIASEWAKLEPKTSRNDINRKAHRLLIMMVVSALGDVMKLNTDRSAALVNFDQKKQIETIACRFSAEQAAEKITETYKALYWVDCSVNERLVFEHLLLNLATSDRMLV